MTDEPIEIYEIETILHVDDEVERKIEELFATAELKNLRNVTRDLEKLVRQLVDPVTKRRYEAAIDQLPDIVAHSGERD
jgi:hypothetical protein